MHNFTSNDLLLYVFNEASSDTTLAIEKAIYTEPGLRDELIALNQTITDIENYSLEPDNKIIENILRELRHESDMHAV